MIEVVVGAVMVLVGVGCAHGAGAWRERWRELEITEWQTCAPSPHWVEAEAKAVRWMWGLRGAAAAALLLGLGVLISNAWVCQ
jgi:hypothetical protein